MGFTGLKFEFQSAESYAGGWGWEKMKEFGGKKEEGALVYDSRPGGNIFENVGAISCNQGLSRAC